MPCGDITERIQLTIDQKNRLDSYSFSKKTCGGAIGLESLILDTVGGLPIDNIISDNDLILWQSNSAIDEVERYLKLKHFSAIQAVLNVYLGLSPGGSGESCTIIGVEFNGKNTVIDAEIEISLMTDRIEPCNHCGPN